MTGFMRILRLLAITVWVGGLVFFAFVVAPVAFTVLPTAHIAGLVVAGTLGVLNIMGLICGVVLLIACTALWTRTSVGAEEAQRRTRNLLAAQLWLVLLMMLATAWVHFRIVPAMERDRIAAGGDVDAAPADNPARRDFERLHPLSEKTEGTALLLGLATIVLIALEPGADPARSPSVRRD